MPTDATRSWITEAEAAEILGMTPNALSLRRRRRAEALARGDHSHADADAAPPSTRLGVRSIRYDRADVEAWADSRRDVPDPAAPAPYDSATDGATP